MEDPYQTLGVSATATQEEIRSAYRKLAKQHHPDLNPGNAEAEARFKAISAAHDLLSDPERRGRFDRGEIDAAGHERAPQSSYRHYAEGEHGHRYSRADSHSGGWSSADLGDIFDSMFSGHRGPTGDVPIRGRDDYYTLAVDFLDAVNGATRRLTLPDGRALDVAIPAGTQDGQILRLRGKGSEGWNGGPNGDALIEIHVAPHRHFLRDGRDIKLELPVTLSEAVLGGQVEIPTPGGPVKMRIPPHSDSGTRLRLRGRGVPAHGGREAGDMHVTLRVVIGQPDAALEAFLRDWKPEHPIDPRQAMEAGR